MSRKQIVVRFVLVCIVR